LQRINPAFSEILGYAESDLLSRRLTDLVHPEDLKAMIDALDDVDAENGVRALETRVECADGSVRWFAWRMTRDADGDWIYGSAREINRDKEVVEVVNEDRDTSVMNEQHNPQYLG
ncbi:MAG: PAS domain-containing protein, partial [Bradymonadaceae bacterium]